MFFPLCPYLPTGKGRKGTAFKGLWLSSAHRVPSPILSHGAERLTLNAGGERKMEKEKEDFPGGPVVKTPMLPMQGMWIQSIQGLIPGFLDGELKSCMPHGEAKNKGRRK